jgi:hypothetical protein
MSMKKKPHDAYPLSPLPPFFKTVNIAETRQAKRKKQYPLPPNEETIVRLNDLAKQSPFCFYYREKDNDVL